ncbi:MAG: C_GCAxxG_C_C family protein [Candidatus Thorarchaeota archaeon]|nr:C_GCAxxG_C_C family protein [Candidatus Thorarchaeota archaeon]
MLLWLFSMQILTCIKTLLIRSYFARTGTWTMEEKNGNRFNCAESVLIKVSRDISLSGFNLSCMKIASAFGGGVGGTQEICGAASGGAMCIGLALGTTGDEPSDVFNEKRTKAREITGKFLVDFGKAWGSTRCQVLTAMDKGEQTADGTLRMNDTAVRNRCDEYVLWAAKQVCELLSRT